MATKFYNNTIKALEIKPKRYDVLETNGFSVRVSPSGSKIFCYVYKFNGKNRRYTIGEYPAMTLANAREIHGQLQARRRLGEDVAADKQITKSHDFDSLCDEYFRKVSAIKKKDGGAEDQRSMKRDVLPTLGKYPAGEITRRQITLLIQEKAEKTPRQANITLNKISAIFNYAIRCGWPGVTVNPAYLIDKAQENGPRKRFLSEDDIREFWHTINNKRCNKGVSDILKLILVTGQRPGECAGICKSEISGEWWTIPTERSKNGEAHRVYLTKTALALIGDRDSFDISSAQVLSRNLNRMFTPLKGESAPRIKAERYTPRDLRRTCASLIGDTKRDGGGTYQDPEIDRLLNHLESKLRRTYNLNKYDWLKQEMLEDWEKKLLAILKGKDTAQ